MTLPNPQHNNKKLKEYFDHSLHWCKRKFPSPILKDDQAYGTQYWTDEINSIFIVLSTYSPGEEPYRATQC
jgi:hypothetical protein